MGVTVRVDQIGGAYRYLVQAAEEGLNKLLLDNHPNFWLDSKAKIWDDTWKLTSGSPTKADPGADPRFLDHPAKELHAALWAIGRPHEA